MLEQNVVIFTRVFILEIQVEVRYLFSDIIINIGQCKVLIRLERVSPVEEQQQLDLSACLTEPKPRLLPAADLSPLLPPPPTSCSLWLALMLEDYARFLWKRSFTPGPYFIKEKHQNLKKKQKPLLINLDFLWAVQTRSSFSKETSRHPVHLLGLQTAHIAKKWCW